MLAPSAPAAAAGVENTRSDDSPPPFSITLEAIRTIRSTAASLCAGTALRASAAASESVYAFSPPSSLPSDRKGSRESASAGFSSSPARGSTGRADSKSKRRREEADGGGGGLFSASGDAFVPSFFSFFFFFFVVVVAFFFSSIGGGKQGAPVELRSSDPSDGGGGGTPVAAVEEERPLSAAAFFCCCFPRPRLRRNSTAEAGRRASASALASAISSGVIEESIAEASPLEESPVGG